jgi:hypothetical protein
MKPPRQPSVSLTPQERGALYERTNGYQLGYEAGYSLGRVWGRVQGLMLGVALVAAAAVAYDWLWH